MRRLDDGDGGAARRREQVLFDLAKRNKADVAETFRAITEATAVALDVERDQHLAVDPRQKCARV